MTTARRRPLQPCAEPGCYQLVPKGRCPAHQPPPRWRPPHPYRSAWARTRAAYLAAHPTCTHCGHPATHADHITRRALLVAQGDPHPDAWHHLQPLCHPCHSRKTGQGQ